MLVHKMVSKLFFKEIRELNNSKLIILGIVLLRNI